MLHINFIDSIIFAKNKNTHGIEIKELNLQQF